MGLRINFGDTKVGDYQAVDAGWYLATITDVEEKESGPKAKHPGSPLLKIELTLKEGSNLTSENKKVFSNASLLPNALYTLMEFCNALGVDTNDDEAEIDYESWVGQDVCIKVNQYEYDGDTQNGVKRIQPAEVYAEKSGGSGSNLP